jgi:hypothetical protein
MASTLYRVSATHRRIWVLVRPACQVQLKDQPPYRYGETKG